MVRSGSEAGMLGWIRTTFGTKVIGGIVAFIAFVFVFYGVFSPRATRGLHEGAVAGQVNGESVSLEAYRSELRGRLEEYKAISPSMTDEQLMHAGIQQSIFQQMAQRAALRQELVVRGYAASTEEVIDQIRNVEVFQKDGKFDPQLYKRILKSQGRTPALFERHIRDEVTLSGAQRYFTGRVHVSDTELWDAYVMDEEKYQLDALVIDPEVVKKDIAVLQQDVDALLQDPLKMNAVSLKFQQQKESVYKNMKLQDVQVDIARSMLAGEKQDEMQKALKVLAGRCVDLMTKKDTRHLQALAELYKLKIKTTPWLTRRDTYISGIGDAPDMVKEVFLHPGPPRIYQLAGRYVVAGIKAHVTADRATFDKDKDTVYAQFRAKKATKLVELWMAPVLKKASIVMNPSILGNAEE